MSCSDHTVVAHPLDVILIEAELTQDRLRVLAERRYRVEPPLPAIGLRGRQ